MEAEDALREARLAGDFSRLPPDEYETCIRVFLCAEPTDSESERRVLRERVYPKLREYCRYTYGMEFQVLDGYHGIDPEDVYLAHVRQCRLKVLQECLRSSVGPCFVALIGEQYGKPCLPTQIDALEFEQITETAATLGLCTKILDAWYCRDENTVPPAYCMLEKGAVILPSGKLESPPAQEVTHCSWNAVARELQALFNAIVPFCVKQGTLKAEQANKYVTSVFEEELLFALKNQPPELLKRCICYIHKIPYESLKKKGKVALTTTPAASHLVYAPADSSDHKKLCQLRDVFLPALARHGRLQVFTSTTTCDMKVGYTEERKQMYLEGLCRQFHRDMQNLIDATVPRKPAHLDRVSEEAMQHLSLCNMYAELRAYECKEMDHIKEYIKKDGVHRTPLIVVGEPCSGKTVLLAACAKKVHLWLKESHPKLVVRFTSHSGDTITLSCLLAGICEQIAENYHKNIKTHLKDVRELRESFVDLLSASSKHSPLVLILDMLDQLSKNDSAKSLWWLPAPFPPFVKVIISTRRESEIFENLLNLYMDQVIFLDLKPQRKMCNENLKQSLISNHRKVTSGQQMYVNRCLERNTSPLLVLLLSKDIMHWRSHEDVNDQALGGTLDASIERLFRNLELKYGSMWVSRALSYITIARSGIGESELADILSTDDTVMDHFLSSGQVTTIWRVPESMVACMVLDLKGCLSRRLFMGSMVLCWTHTLYPFVVHKRYLNNASVSHDLHASIGYYFSGRWASGRAKSYSVKDPLIGTHLKSDQSLDSKRASKIYIDRQQPSQPWILGPQSCNESPFRANIRKALELPFHLKKCGRLDELCDNMLTMFQYYKAMIKADQLYLLLTEVEDTARHTGRKELNYIGDILTEANCLLDQNPASLEMVLQAAILPLTTECPSLLKFLKQVQVEGLKHSAIVALHSPLIAIAAKHVQTVESSSIICVLEMEVEQMIIVVYANAALYTWKVGGPLTLVHRSLQDILARDAQVSQDGRHLVLMVSNCLLIFDCATWAVLCEINRDRFPITPLDTCSPVVLKAFHLLANHLYVWFENASFVRVFSIPSGDRLSDLACQGWVNCFSSTEDGKYVLFGQQNTVAIFDSCTFLHHATIPVTFSRYSVKDVHISESAGEVFIVDTTGNISVWDILDPLNVQCLDEIYSLEETDEVILSEYSPEYKWLLLCKLKLVCVWDTDGWGMEEYRAPQNNSFAYAVFTDDCEHIIAALETGSSLLMWRRDSGQCVLKLDFQSGKVTKLTKCFQQSCLIAVMKEGFLSTWNMDLIRNAASIFKAKQPIQSILLSSAGDHFYTVDGSEVVYKWRCSSFTLQAFLKHDKAVENAQLTANGKFLVTLETHGDLHVWCTETEGNICRIHGSHASQVILAPNGHIGVALGRNSVSRVWNLNTGNLVCTFHAYLLQARITPESTFVMGLQNNDLTAYSLWSGCVSKKFQCDDKSILIAFNTLRSHPDLTVVITASLNIYTWNVAEETICHQIELPNHFPSQESDCQMSSDGSIIIKIAENGIHVLNTHSGKLGVLHTGGSVLYQHLSKHGRLIAYVCFTSENKRDCDFHANPVLYVAQISNGKTVGQYYLGKMPSCMTVSDDDRMICIGYDDGTVGVYTVAETDDDRREIQSRLSFRSKDAQPIPAIKTFLSKEIPDVFWVDSREGFAQTL